MRRAALLNLANFTFENTAKFFEANSYIQKVVSLGLTKTGLFIKAVAEPTRLRQAQAKRFIDVLIIAQT
jgi:hypothetical protein